MEKPGQCAAETKTGSRCRGTALPGKGVCFVHDPGLNDQRQTWAKAAGRAKSNQARMRKQLLGSGMDLQEVDAALCVAMKGVMTGKIEPGIANAAATVARAIVAVRTAGDLEQRLERLEAAHENGRAS